MLTASCIAKHVIQMCMLAPVGQAIYMHIETQKHAKKTRLPMCYHHNRKTSHFFSFFSLKTIQQNTPQVTSPLPVHAAPFLPESICQPRGITHTVKCIWQTPSQKPTNAHLRTTALADKLLDKFKKGPKLMGGVWCWDNSRQKRRGNLGDVVKGCALAISGIWGREGGG